MTTIDGLQIEVEASAGKAEKEIDNLTETLKKLDKATKSSGLDKICEKLEKISSLNLGNLAALSAVSGQGSALEKVQKKVNKAVSPAVDNMPKITTASYGDALSNVQNQMAETTSAVGNITPKIDIDVSAPGTEKVKTDFQILESKIAEISSEKAQINIESYDIQKCTEKLSFVNRLLGNVKSTAKSTSNTFTQFGEHLKQFGSNALDKTRKKLQTFSKMLTRLLFYRAFRIFTNGISEGLKNIARYSDETARNMNKLSTNSLYLKNSVGAALYPALVAITPALENITNAIVKALNALNQFIAAWGGATTFIKAKKYMKEYCETAKTTANNIKKYFAGMDEIHVLGDTNGSGNSSDTPDYSQMFETAPISENTQKIIDNLKQNLDNLKTILGGALLAIGAILMFSGANIPLGLGLMVAGALMLGSAVSENWNSLNSALEDKISAIMIILGGALLVLGAVLAFSGANIPLGIALMIGGALLIGTTVALNWKGMPDKIKNIITIIGIALGAAVLVLGAILAFTGANIPLGIGLMIAGASELATAVALGWDKLPDKVKNIITIITIAISSALLVLGVCLFWTGVQTPLGVALMALGAAGLVAAAKLGWEKLPNKVKNIISIITAIVSTALLVLGVILTCTGVATHLGVALIVAGAAGLVTAIAVNWDWVKSKINTVLSATLAIISGFGLVLGILLCLTGAGIPLGIGLILASIKGVKKASDMNDNPITNFVKKMANGIIDIFEKTINFIANKLNTLSWKVPDWVPGIGGSTFGLNIQPISIPRLKNGGFPDGEDGLFYANHNELIGQFTNGRTAVANNDQIVDGIRSGVYDANQEQNNLLREQNRLLRQILDKESDGEINVSTITKAQSRNNRRHGKTIVPVGT